MTSLLTPWELDDRLRYPSGRCIKLARKGVLPHVRLPDGEIRFNEDEIEKLLQPVPATRADGKAVANA